VYAMNIVTFSVILGSHSNNRREDNFKQLNITYSLKAYTDNKREHNYKLDIMHYIRVIIR